jgi:protein-disulfide isomerase
MLKEEDTKEEKSSPFLSPAAAILIGSLVISFSILLAGGIIRLKGIEGRQLGINNQPQATLAPNDALGEEENLGPVKVSLDDDPMIGDKNAPVTLVEFSDYECPFCKKYFEETYSQIKKDYIDSGKVKLVFRDLPLSFHDPMATTEAIAANCAREQGGDGAYFSFHDEMFKKTTSNGNGLTKDDLYAFASSHGLNSGNFKTCLDTEKFKDEVQKDLSDATSYGANATPTFYVGKSSTSKEIEGTAIVGAQPYAAFKALIDQKLAE